MEIAARMSIPRASAFRIVRTLEARDYLVNTDKPYRYAVGLKLLRLGGRITRESNLRQIASSFLYRLANETRQTVQLATLFGYKVLYIDQVRTPSSTDIFIEPTGTPFAVNISAGGKVMVSLLNARSRKDFLEHAELARQTKKTIVSLSSFEKELDRTAAQGYAIDDEEFAVGIRCVAAPILDAKGHCIAALGITGHISRITDEALPGMIKATRHVASEISRALGYIPKRPYSRTLRHRPERAGELTAPRRT